MLIFFMATCVHPEMEADRERERDRETESGRGDAPIDLLVHLLDG